MIYWPDDRLLEGIRLSDPDFDPDPSKHYRILECQMAPVAPRTLNLVSQTYLGCNLFNTQNIVTTDLATHYGAVGCLSDAVSNITEVYELEECDVYEQGELIWRGVQNFIGFPPNCGQTGTNTYAPTRFEFSENEPPDPPSYCGNLPNCCGQGGQGATITGRTSSAVYEIDNGVTSWRVQT